MFIRIPGTTCEGDFADSATSHHTLGSALAGLEKLSASDTITVLDTARVPLAVVATARCYGSRAAAEKDRAVTLEAPNDSELLPGAGRSTVLLRRFA